MDDKISLVDIKLPTSFEDFTQESGGVIFIPKYLIYKHIKLYKSDRNQEKGDISIIVTYGDGSNNICLKITSNEEEADMSDLLIKEGVDTWMCDILNTRVIGSKEDEYYIAMNCYTMDLNRYMDIVTMPIEDRLKIIKKVYETMDCLYKHGFVYLDLKPSNVLVNIDSKSRITEIVLGDIGSIFKKSKIGISTYPTPFLHCNGILRANKRNMAWVYAVFCLFIMDEYYGLYSYTYVNDYFNELLDEKIPQKLPLNIFNLFVKIIGDSEKENLSTIYNIFEDTYKG